MEGNGYISSANGIQPRKVFITQSQIYDNFACFNFGDFFELFCQKLILVKNTIENGVEKLFSVKVTQDNRSISSLLIDLFFRF